MRDFAITLSDATRVCGGMLWQGVVRAEDGNSALAVVADRIEPSVLKKIRSPLPEKTHIRRRIVEVVPFLTPDLVQTNHPPHPTQEDDTILQEVVE